MKTSYYLNQNNGKGPPFPTQPGNGNGNPPPFQQAPIDTSIHLGLFVGVFLGMYFILRRKLKKN